MERASYRDLARAIWRRQVRGDLSTCHRRLGVRPVHTPSTDWWSMPLEKVETGVDQHARAEQTRRGKGQC